MNTEKTTTLGNEDEPTFTLFPGHVSMEVFNEAFKKEGWNNEDLVADEAELKHEYWEIDENNHHKYIRNAYPNLPNVIPVTVLEW